MVRQLTRSSPCSQPIIRAATPEQWLPLPPVTQEAVSATQRQWLPLPPRTRTSKGSRTRHLLSSPFFAHLSCIRSDTAASPKTCGPMTHVVVPPPLRGHLPYYRREAHLIITTTHTFLSHRPIPGLAKNNVQTSRNLLCEPIWFVGDGEWAVGDLACEVYVSDPI